MQGSLRSIIKQYVKYYGKLPVVLVLIAIGIVLLNFILGKAVLNSQDEVIDELSSRSEELRLRVDAKQSGKGISAERVAGIKADLRSYKDSFIKEAEITSLISDVDKAASKSSLTIEGSDNRKVSFDKHGVNAYVMKFSVIGSYRNIKKFIYSIETMDNVIVLEDLSLRRSKGGKVALSVSLMAYYL